MKKTEMHSIKYVLSSLFFLLALGTAGCSSDATNNSAPGALPSPSVNCGGSSCVD